MTSLPAFRAGRHMAVPALHAPNAALLIDFDNVTLGVRSDLTKELRTLLNSDIIKGKVQNSPGSLYGDAGSGGM